MNRSLSALSGLRIRHLVAAAIFVLPLLPYLSLHVPAGHLVRYSVEGIVDVAAVVALALRPRTVVARLAPLAIVVGALLAYWLFTDLWNLVSWQTPAVAARADLRFLPIAVLIAAASDPLSDAALYLNSVLGAALVQAVLSILFAVHVNATMQTTLGDRNQLGVFLMLGCILLAASFHRLDRRIAISVAAVLAGGFVGAASRESAIGLVYGLLGVFYFRVGRRRRPAIVLLAAAFAVVFLLPTIVGRGSGALDSRSIAVRWRQLFSANLSPTTNFRMQLLSDNAKLVARHEPLFGFGFGTASAPTVVEDLTSPVYRSFPGYDLVNRVEPFVYDSNWAIVVLETGFVGVLLLASGLASLAWLGVRARAGWYGLALAPTVLALAIAAFAGPAFREPLPSLVVWVLGALSLIALRTSRDANVPTPLVADA